jgi:sulfite reductase alpha subunit
LADAADLRSAWYRRFLDDVQYPRFPHKVKVKFSGCPNDCARAQQKADIGVTGIFRDAPKIDQGRLQEWLAQGNDVHRIVMNCPTKAMEYDGQTLTIDAASCVHCMYCINKCSYAIRPGDDRGVAVTVGGKLRGKYGPLLGKVLIPFLPLNPPDYPEIMDTIEKIAAVYDENAKRKERLGDFLFRVGMDQFTKWMGIEPSPRQLAAPRSNVFFHWEAEEISRDSGALATAAH